MLSHVLLLQKRVAVRPGVKLAPFAFGRSVGSMLNLEQYAKIKSTRQQDDQALAESTFSAAQCRGARGMLAWNQGQLADAANVSRMTVVEFEGGRRLPHANNLAAIRTALEAAGVEFIEENGGGPGVRLRGQQNPSSA